MNIITLTSDYGTKDFFAGAIKGAILSQTHDVTIIDISHNITPFHLPECAYIVRNSYKEFPENSIHIIAVDTEKQKNKRHIAAYIDNHYFITSDSGILSLIFPKTKAKKIVTIHHKKEANINLFPAKHIFSKAACHIIKNKSIDLLGEAIYDIKTLMNINPVEMNNGKSLIGDVIYIDQFGNIITNINKFLFNQVRVNRNFTIHLPRGKKIEKIHNTYSDVEESEIVILFNSSQLLEIAINRADRNVISGASTLLGIIEGDQIIINFE